MNCLEARSTRASLPAVVLILAVAVALLPLDAAQAASKRSVTLAASTATAAPGARVSLTGKASKTPAKATIRIQRLSGGAWTTIATVKTVKKGRFSTAVANPGYGTFSYRADAPKKGHLAAADSHAITIASPAPVAPPLPPPAAPTVGGNQVPASEVQALVDLYNATDGPNWVEHSNWLSNNTVCSWYGVYCNDAAYDDDGNPILTNHNAHVDRVFLGFNGLTGAVPTSISQLTQLTELALYQEGLTSVPASIGTLSHLTYLDINGNNLASVPTEIGDLTNLTGLDISRNGLTVIPSSIGNLTKLTNLDVSYSQAASLPDSIGNLTNLLQLHAYKSYLTSLPSTIGQLSSLQLLDIGYDRITSLPTSIGQLPNLDSLFAYDNHLTGDISGWAAGLKATNKMQSLLLSDGADSGNYGLTVGNNPALSQWLSNLDPNWNEAS